MPSKPHESLHNFFRSPAVERYEQKFEPYARALEKFRLEKGRLPEAEEKGPAAGKFQELRQQALAHTGSEALKQLAKLMDRHAAYVANDPRSGIHVLAHRAGVRGARQRLLVEHTPLLIRKVVAARWKTRGEAMDLSDLMQEGASGLLRALRSFDPERKAKMLTHAGFWIDQKIRRAASASHLVKPTSTTGGAIRKWYLDRTGEALKRGESISRLQLGRELAARLSERRKKPMPLREALDLLRSLESSLRPVTSLEREGREGMRKLLELAARPEEVHRPEAWELLDMVNKLKPRQRDILIHRYGLGGEREKTLKEVGEKLGITRERVRQIQNEALEKLRRMMERAGRRPEEE